MHSSAFVGLFKPDLKSIMTESNNTHNNITKI